MLATLLFDEDTFWSVERGVQHPDHIDLVIAHDNGKGDFYIFDEEESLLDLFKEAQYNYSRSLGCYPVTYEHIRLLFTPDTFDGIINDIQRVHDREVNACGKN